MPPFGLIAFGEIKRHQPDALTISEAWFAERQLMARMQPASS